jgi:peptide/nickel transport system permease protein
MSKKNQDQQSTTRIFISNFLHNPSGVIGLAIISVMILTSIFAVQISGVAPDYIDPINSRLGPSWSHLFGTDQLGRDMFSRILSGGRQSIYIGVLASFMANLIGTVLGATAGYLGGKIDTVVMRISELVMTFPQLILVLIFVSLLGQGINNVIIVFALTGWMTTFRLVRGEFFSLREEAFVEADRAFGFSKPRIIFRHLLPNTMSPIVVAFTVNIAIFIIAEAGLSFLGLGVPVTTPTWGNLLTAAQNPVVVNEYWWLWVFPALAIAIFVLGVNFVGDGLRDVLDPRHKSLITKNKWKTMVLSRLRRKK